MSMAQSINDLLERLCPVCGATAASADLFLQHSVDPSRLTSYSYASRKTPEYMSFRFLKCHNCTTVYASPAPPPNAITAAYQSADYDSSEEAILAAETYGSFLAPFLRDLPATRDALEIGTGTGAFLTELLQLGFERVVGIEPSQKAIAAADPVIRNYIREGIFSADAFEPETFDLVCCFMTLEHVTDPLELAVGARRLLRPGGLLAVVTHNYKAPINRILGRKSPIVDIEHLQIFCPTSLEHLVTKAGLQSLGVHSYANRYPLAYWLRLLPLPFGTKALMSKTMANLSLDRKLLTLNVGNVMTVARKAQAQP